MKKILSSFSVFFFLLFSIANASYLGSWKIDDYLTFSCNTHDPDTGVATDATSAPTYRIYEDETTSAILTGSTAKLDDGNTTGFYTERIQLTAANGFEKGKSYTVYIAATVDGDAGTMSHNFQIEAEVDSNVVSASNVSANIEQVGGDAIQDNNDGQLEVNVEKWNDTALPADVQAGYPTVIIKDGTGTGEVDTDSGTVLLRPATETQIDEIETDTGTTLENHLTDIKGTGFVKDTHSLPQCLTATSTTCSDKTGFSLSAAGIDSIWDEVITGHSTGDSFGKVFDDQVDGLRTYGDGNWTTAVGFSTHNAADVRAEIDNNSTKLSAIEADAQDIQSRIPAALSSDGNIKADVLAISGDTTAADNLESQYDGTGLMGDNYPSNQKQVGLISSGAAAIATTAESATITTGTETGTYANTTESDETFHIVEPDGGITDFYYQFDIGSNALPVGIDWEGYANGQGDEYESYAYNWNSSSWEQIGTCEGINGASLRTMTRVLTTAHVGTSGGDIGKVRFRIHSTTGSKVATDRLLCTYSIVAPTATEIRTEMEDTGTKLSLALEDTDELQTNQGNWATFDGNGTTFTDIPWNSDWDADVQSEVADALDAVIPATPTDGSINSKIKRLRR